MPDTLTDKLHDWASSFLGTDTRTGAPNAAPGPVGGSLPPPPSAPPATASAPLLAGTDPATPAQTSPAPASSPAPAPVPAASTAKAPTVTVAPVPIEAASVTDFKAKGNAHFGGKQLGETDWQLPPPKWELDKDGKPTALDFTLTITVSFVTLNGGSPDANNEKAIKDAAARTKAHEERHQRDIEAAWQAWDPAKVRSDLMAKTFKTAKGVTDAINAETAKMKKAIKDACLKLHSTEGVVEVSQNSDGTFTVKETAAGPSGCK